MSDLRYSAKLVLHVEEIDGRWHGSRNDRDEICRLAIARRRTGEIAIVTDNQTGESVRIELDGAELLEVPL